MFALHRMITTMLAFQVSHLYKSGAQNLTTKVIADVSNYFNNFSNFTNLKSLKLSSLKLNFDAANISLFYYNKRTTRVPPSSDCHSKFQYTVDMHNECDFLYNLSAISFISHYKEIENLARITTANPVTKNNIPEFFSTAKENYVNAVIFKLDDVKKSKRHRKTNETTYYCDCESLNKQLQKSFKGNFSLNRNLVYQIGIEYSIDLIDCCKHYVFEVLLVLDISVLEISIRENEILLNYGLFVDTVEESVRKHRDFVRATNPYCRRHIRVVVDDHYPMATDTILVFKKVANILAHRWAKEFEGDETLVLEYNDYDKSNLNSAIDWKIQQHVFNRVIPVLTSIHMHMHHYDNFGSSCEMEQILGNVFGTFDNILLSSQAGTFGDSFTGLSEDCTTNSRFSLLKNKTIHWIERLNNVERSTELLLQIFNMSAQINLKTMYFDVDQEKLEDGLVQKIMKLIPAEVNVGCEVESNPPFEKNLLSVETILGNLKQKCSIFSERLTEYLLVYRISNNEGFSKQLPSILKRFQEIVNHIQNVYPDKLVTPMFLISDPSKSNQFSFKTMIPQNIRMTIYCSKDARQINELYDAIMMFGITQNWTKLFLQYALDSGYNGGWWQSIDVDKDVNRSATNFPLMVRRNSPRSLVDLNFANTYDCLQWTQNANAMETGINFRSTDRVGVTLRHPGYNKNLTFNTTELQIAMLFSYYRFNLVEFVLESSQDLKMLEYVFSTDFFQTVQSFHEHGVSLFAEISLADFHVTSLNEITNLLNKPTYFKSSGLSFRDWEITTQQGLLEFAEKQFNNFNTSRMKLGVTMQNCIEEINSGMAGLKSLAFFSRIQYIICNLKSVLGANFNQIEMQTYLDTNFYIKTYIEKVLKAENFSVDVYLRVNLLANGNCQPGRLRVENFLRFMSDLKEHSNTYNITYFVVKALSPRNNDECPTSWWRIENFTDLADGSQYIEWEAEHFDKVTHIPKLITDDTSKAEDKTIVTELLVGILVLFAIFMIAVMTILGLRFRNLRKRYLTEAEETRFRKGIVVTSSAGGSIREEIKFDESFEIEKRYIELCKAIGRGNFGIVYKALLHDEMEVAVKMPHSECTKESYMSMLVEVKTLCYVGSHPNVLAFIGAYTQDIGTGQIYIVTELCENGNLNAHLKSTSESSSHPDLYELYRFSYQIAVGMNYLVERRVIHGDLSTRNILLNAELTCKIADFGLARRLYESDKYVRKRKESLPWRWMAIESLKNLEFTSMSDVWSYGITIFEIFTLGII